MDTHSGHTHSGHTHPGADHTANDHIPVKFYRSDARLTVAAPMPGMEPENILIEVTADGILALHGIARGEFKGDKEVLLDEWNPGPYHRRLALPAPVDGELANVTYGNGVLVVTLPLADRTRAAQLSLNSVGPAHGERIGSHGNPVRPTTAAEHHARGADTWERPRDS